MNTRNNLSNSKSKLIGTIASWTIFVLLFFVAIFLVYYVITIQLYDEKENAGGPPIYLYTIISGSMHPTIKVYDVVVDKRVKKPTDIKKDDIITFISEESLTYGYTITHRVIDVIEDNGTYKYRTKGDYNNDPDNSYVTFDDVVGKVMFKIPQLGRIQFLLLKAGSWLFLVLIPVLGIVVYDIIKISNLFSTKKKIEKINNKNNTNNNVNKDKQEKLKVEIKNRLVNNNLKNMSKLKYNKIDTSKNNSIKKKLQSSSDLNMDKILKKIDKK